MPVAIRLASADDAAPLAELLTRNREFLAPWDPVRDEAYYTTAGQRDLLARSLRRFATGAEWPGVILVGGAPVGRVNLNNVVRGAFCSADLGYWVDQAHNGRGVATAAVGAVVRLAFDDLGLHRVQAGTLLHNSGSQRVLERNGFTVIGVAPGLSPDRRPLAGPPPLPAPRPLKETGHLRQLRVVLSCRK